MVSSHKIHVSLPLYKLLDAGTSPHKISFTREFFFKLYAFILLTSTLVVSRKLMSQLYPSFLKNLHH